MLEHVPRQPLCPVFKYCLRTDAHLTSIDHLSKLRRVLADDAAFDQFVKESSLTEQHLDSIEACVAMVKQAVHQADVHVVGSVGKGTAVADDFDVDIITIVPGAPALPVLKTISSQLWNVGFTKVVLQERKNNPGRRLITAKFNNLCVDLIATDSLLDGGWAQAQCQHMQLVAAMPSWKKNLVIALKAWTWLNVPVLGFLLECVVISIPDEYASKARLGFLFALRRLLEWRAWPDPCDPHQDLGKCVQMRNLWSQLAQYCWFSLMLATHTCVCLINESSAPSCYDVCIRDASCLSTQLESARDVAGEHALVLTQKYKVSCRDALAQLFVEEPAVYSKFITSLPTQIVSQKLLCRGLLHVPRSAITDTVGLSAQDLRCIIAASQGLRSIKVHPGNFADFYQQVSEGPLPGKMVRFRVRIPLGCSPGVEGLQIIFFPWPPRDDNNHKWQCHRLCFFFDEAGEGMDIGDGQWQEFVANVQQGEGTIYNVTKKRYERNLAEPMVVPYLACLLNIKCDYWGVLFDHGGGVECDVGRDGPYYEIDLMLATSDSPLQRLRHVEILSLPSVVCWQFIFASLVLFVSVMYMRGCFSKILPSIS